VTEVPPPGAAAARPHIREIAELDDLATVRGHVVEAARQAALDPDRTAGLTVAVNEVVTNAITHGMPPATVTITLTGGAVLITVHDRGTRFADLSAVRTATGENAAEAAPPGPDHVRGRGLWLASALCDRVDIRAGAGGTTVTLTMEV
jgi:anti-sigma regulatory factor (Ser/Thr protein kinase)